MKSEFTDSMFARDMLIKRNINEYFNGVGIALTLPLHEKKNENTDQT